MTEYYADWDGKLRYRQEMTVDPEIAFCENGDCNVLVFMGSEEQQNCPGCGQFGRFKNQVTEHARVPWMPPEERPHEKPEKKA